MALFRVRLSRGAEADLLAVPFPFRRQLNQHILRLKDDPFPAESAPKDDGIGRALSVEGCTLLYDVDETRRTVVILAVRRP